MEITCNRCHGALQAEDCFCPTCGLPQLVYSADAAAAPGQPERWNEAARDASVVLWRPALRVALLLAIPAGLLCSGLSPVSIFGLLWMAAAAAWAVILYVRNQQAPWITLGAGARIGLVTGILGGWTAAGTTGVTLVIMRFVLHHGKQIDNLWEGMVKDEMGRQWAAAGVDSHTIALYQGWLLSPEGRAGAALGGVLFLVTALVFFAVAGGALGARLMATRRPQA
jgi:hypothetical protein